MKTWQSEYVEMLAALDDSVLWEELQLTEDSVETSSSPRRRARREERVQLALAELDRRGVLPTTE